MTGPKEAHQMGRALTKKAHAIPQTVPGDCFGDPA